MPRNDGLDISYHQGTIDWPQVPVYPMMSTKATDGGGAYSLIKQAVHRSYYLKFRERGHRWRGSYHWIRGLNGTVEQQAVYARQQADFYLSWLASVDGLQAGEFVQLDWETGDHPTATPAQVEEWVARVETAVGRPCVIVYSSDWVPGFAEWRRNQPAAPLWYANYSQSTLSNGGRAECAKYGAHIWQWTSAAQVPGITGGVDANEVLDPYVLDHLSGLADDVTKAEYDAVVKQIADLTALTWKVASDVEALKRKLGVP